MVARERVSLDPSACFSCRSSNWFTGCSGRFHFFQLEMMGTEEAIYSIFLRYMYYQNTNLGTARHLYVVCIYGAICLPIQKYFSPDRAVFSPKNKILILFYAVSRFMQKNSRFRGKIARYNVLKIKFVDISHHRYKLRRDIE
jgi:hypothetical protein